LHGGVEMEQTEVNPVSDKTKILRIRILYLTIVVLYIGSLILYIKG